MAGRVEVNEAYGLGRFRKILARKIRADGYFAAGRRVVVARAPGRLDLMGGIADYSGSLVLQYPILEATFTAAQTNASGRVRVESLINTAALHSAGFEADVGEFEAHGRLGSIQKAREFFSTDQSSRWAAYVIGALVVLGDAFGTRVKDGLRLLIHSEVPLGKGVSSSAALEVSVMMALIDLMGLPEALSCREIALLSQRVENEIVGAPCGVMDQLASACGEEDTLIKIRCRPAELDGVLKLPGGVAVWGIDSGIRHSVAGADYGRVRTAAAMGYRMIAYAAGLRVEKAGPGRVVVLDDEWNGYLAAIEPERYLSDFAELLPDSLNGGEFLDRFHGIVDPFSSVDPNVHYPVRAATAHPIFENARVDRYARELESSNPDLVELGSLMLGSHESYSACGLGSDGTDLLVDLVEKEKAGGGLFGAKITGGGGGGTVAVLGRRGSDASVAGVAADYERLTGRRARIFTGSSNGACRFGLREAFFDL